MYKLSALMIGGLAALAIAGGSAWAAHHEAGEGDGKGHRHHRHGHRGFEKRDADGNGEVSKAEWMASSEERFGKLDADGNGSISQEEWKAAHERMKERHKKKSEGGGY